MDRPGLRLRRANRIGLCAALLAVVVAPGMPGASASVASGSQQRTAVLGHVSDGDTLVLRDGTAVRLIGIDTPETQNPDFGVECFGKAATRFTKHLLDPGDRLRLVLDVETRDRYGRLLAYVYRASDGLFVNAAIVRRGYAYVSTIPPNVKHAEQFRRLAAEARNAGRGLWAGCNVKGSRHGERPPPSSSKKHCLRQYRGACVPPPPPDYDCPDFQGPITITGEDVQHLDGNGDGIACERPG